MTTDAIPVIDLELDPDETGRELDQICREVGFFQIVGHGVDPVVADDAWAAAVAFFDLPLESRLACRPADAGYPYGYIPMAAEALSASTGAAALPDLKEVYNAGPDGIVPTPELEDPDEAWAWSPNLWPADLPELQRAWTALHVSLLDLSGRIMELFARGLLLPPDFFVPFIDRSASALRALRYPARTTPAEEGQFRAGAHTDYGTLTLLRQDTVGGLQVKTAEDTWADVPSIDGAYVVNIGDLMARWTNDRWRSTLHRVVDPASPDGQYPTRHSMPFFHNANWDARIDALPTCVPAGTVAHHEPVLAGPHLMGKFRKTAVPS